MGLQQLLEKLLGLDSFIQVNKTLIQKLGLHEAILISELYSERSYWRKQNKLRDDEWFYSTRENLEENTGLTPYYQRDAISNLTDMGILECKLMDTPAKKYYSIVDDKLLKALTACCENVSQLDVKGFNDINNNKIKTIEDNNNQKSTVPGALAKHPRNFSKNTLTDDLQSGKDIDEQKKIKKKTSEYDKCLAEIDKRYSVPSIHSAVLNHLEWSYNSKDPNRIKTLKTFVKRLDELDKLILGKTTDVAVKIIQQSIDKKWQCFYEIKEGKSYSKNTIDNAEITSQKSRTDEEIEQLLAQRLERNGIV